MRKLLAALVVIGGLVLANFSQSAYATPQNTVFDRVVGGCTYDFIYGNYYVPYAKFKVVGSDPSGYNCIMISATIWEAKGGDINFVTSDTPYGSCNDSDVWCDQNTWHQVLGDAGWSGYTGHWLISVWQNNSSCQDIWGLDASIYESYPEGHWTVHNYTC
jgi:hypothetical protein